MTEDKEHGGMGLSYPPMSHSSSQEGDSPNLTVVAVLGAFGAVHEVTKASQIPNYFAYYVVIFSMWTAQTAYIIRYESNDKFNRLCRLIAICLFVYVGAASGGWDLAHLRSASSDYTTDELVAQDLVNKSFLTVVLAAIILRALLVVQYLTGEYQWSCLNAETSATALGNKVGRSSRPPLYSALSLVVSIVFMIVAVAVPASSSALASLKIAMLFIGIGWDFASALIQVVLGLQTPTSAAEVGERLGCLSLIIIGEAFLRITPAFQRSLDGIGSNDTSLYANVFLVVCIMFFIWWLFFANYDKEDEVDQGRIWLWEVIHFPLLFCLLLMIAAFVNVVVINSWGHDLSNAVGLFQASTSAMDPSGGLAHKSQLNKYLGGLSLTPDFDDQYNYIFGLLNQTLNSVRDEVPGLDNATMAQYQYTFQIIYQATSMAAIEIPDEVETNYREMWNWNISNPVNETQYELLPEMTLGALAGVSNEGYAGTRWLFPAAGAVLILCALRSMAMYHFKGVAQHVVHGMQLVFGFCLALLGLLNIGPHELIDEKAFAAGEDNPTNPMYTVVDAYAAVAIVFAVYGVVVLGTTVILWCANRRDRKRFQYTAPHGGHA